MLHVILLKQFTVPTLNFHYLQNQRIFWKIESSVDLRFIVVHSFQTQFSSREVPRWLLRWCSNPMVMVKTSTD